MTFSGVLFGKSSVFVLILSITVSQELTFYTLHKSYKHFSLIAQPLKCAEVEKNVPVSQQMFCQISCKKKKKKEATNLKTNSWGRFKTPNVSKLSTRHRECLPLTVVSSFCTKPEVIHLRFSICCFSSSYVIAAPINCEIERFETSTRGHQTDRMINNRLSCRLRLQ